MNKYLPFVSKEWFVLGEDSGNNKDSGASWIKSADNMKSTKKNLQVLADKINAIIHRDNLYFIATGERYVNAHVSPDGTCVLVDNLYRNVGQQYHDGAFRNSRGHAVYLLPL